MTLAPAEPSSEERGPTWRVEFTRLRPHSGLSIAMLRLVTAYATGEQEYAILSSNAICWLIRRRELGRRRAANTVARRV